jgi:predicted MFS family arabinose efflux permease
MRGCLESLPLTPAVSTRRAAWALRAQFFVAGALFATWGVHVPTVKAQYALDERELAFAMLAAGIGSVLTLPQAGRIVARFGARRVAFVTGPASAVCIGALLAFDSYLLLLLLMMLYGAAGALFDVTINASATEVETRARRPLMSGFHALFSLGGMVGAAMGSAWAAVSGSPLWHVLSAGAVAVLMVLAAAPFMLPPEPAKDEGRTPLALPRGPLALLGLLAAMGLIAEGAMYDWSVLFLKQERGAGIALAALAYASFSAAMTAGRFAGDAVRARFDAVTVLRASGTLGALGMVLALVAPQPWVGLLGFAIVGLGFANIVPVLFSAAGRVEGVSAASGIAAVSSAGYFGMMIGPPWIGAVAQHWSLSAGLALVVLFALAVALAAKRAIRP